MFRAGCINDVGSTPVAVMTVDKNDFQKRTRKGKGTVAPKMINIRLRYIGPSPPTRHMSIQALQHLLDFGKVPERWQFAAIDWKNPKRSTEWQNTGDEVDLEAFAPMIQTALHNARVAIVRR